MTSAQSQFFGINLVEHLDEAKIAPLARATKAAGVAIVPTEGFLVGRYGTLPADSLVARPEMRYWLPNQVTAWANDKRTVDAHVDHIYTKLGITNRATAALKALHLGLLPEEPSRR